MRQMIKFGARRKGICCHHRPSQGECSGLGSGSFHNCWIRIAQERMPVGRAPSAEESDLAGARHVDDCGLAAPIRLVRQAIGTTPQGKDAFGLAEQFRLVQRRQRRSGQYNGRGGHEVALGGEDRGIKSVMQMKRTACPEPGHQVEDNASKRGGRYRRQESFVRLIGNASPAAVSCAWCARPQQGRDL